MIFFLFGSFCSNELVINNNVKIIGVDKIEADKKQLNEKKSVIATITANTAELITSIKKKSRSFPFIDKKKKKCYI